MKLFLIFTAFLLGLTNINQATASNQFVIGVLADENLGDEESLKRFINIQMHPELFNKSITFFPNFVMNQTGGLLKKINYFKEKSTNIILDLQRNNEQTAKLAEHVKVPVISIAPQSESQRPFVVSIYPDITIINDAIVEYLLRYKKEEGVLLFDKRRSRQAMNLHTKSQKYYIGLEMMPELIMDNMQMLKDVIRMAWETQIKTVVLLCDTKDIKTVVIATLQARLYDRDRQNWKWIVSDMDFQTPDYEPLEGFAGFVLPQPSDEVEFSKNFKNQIVRKAIKEKVYSDVFYASLFDAIQLMNQLALRLHNMNKNNINARNVQEALEQIHLPACVSHEQKNCSFTGKIEFDANGLRKIEHLDFVVIDKNKLSSRGNWNSNPEDSDFPEVDKVRWVGDVVGNYICHEKRDIEPMEKSKKNLTIMIKRSDPPFVNESESSKDGFEGFAIDIVRELAKRMDFDYTFKVLESGGSGSKKDGKWNGFVGSLIEKNVDMATGSFTITAEREDVIDFSKPFMDFRMALILKIPEEEKSLFNFHKPFSWEIWLMVVSTVFAMTFLLYCVDFFSPLGYRKTAEETGEGEEFNIMNSLWFATASMLQQGGDNTPKAPSGRILASAFWFFILIIISTYTANLAAFFTNKKIESKIQNLEDLVKSKIKYGVLKDGQLFTFLRDSKSPTHRKMFSHITEVETTVNGSKAGVARARRGGYAYLTEIPILEYWSSRRPCNTMLVKNLLEVKSYGFGLPKNSENTNVLSVNILKLREEGFIEKRRKFWWEDKAQCMTRKPSSATVTLELHSLGGVFIVMIGGSIISFILLAIEIKFKWIIDLIMKAQENHAGSEEQRSEAVMRVEISQGERTLNPINRAEPSRRRWFSPLGLSR